MREKGLSRHQIMELLDNHLAKDTEFRSGKIVGSMCTEPHGFAKQIYSEFIEKNIGDPGLVRGTLEMERECISMMGSLLSHTESYGNIVSGGTEANIIALWSARNEMKKDKPEVIVATNAHHSFKKAADLLGVRLVRIPCDDSFTLDSEIVKQTITPNTIMLVGTAGSTNLGLIDPIDELAEISETFDVPLHVDASFGGFVIPFLKELGYIVPDFDFSLKGVRTITIDPHKMGMAPIPASCILFRENKSIDGISSRVNYLSGGVMPRDTVLGTSPGASIIAVWALINLLGKRGYRRVVDRCMRRTQYLYEQINHIDGVEVVTPPMTNIIGLRVNGMKLSDLTNRLRRRGFAVSVFQDHIRLVIMPHLTQEHIDEFLEILREIVKNSNLKQILAPKTRSKRLDDHIP